MGAINYFTSDYITLGIRPYEYSDFTSDPDFMEELQKDIDEYGGTVEQALSNYINDCYECDYENIKAELEKHHFHYYNITIKPGYYEGFTLDIENNYGIAYDTWEDRRDALKEITRIKQFLIDCAGLGLVKCSPGWCTGYSGYNETITAIKAAIKGMREEVKIIPTWAQYERSAANGGVSYV